MSADPSSFNFDTGLSNIGISDPTMGLNTSGLGTNTQPFDPQGPINESDLIGGSSGGSSYPTVGNLNAVNVGANTGTIDPSTIGNPFAGANGGPPLTGSNFDPSMTNIGFDPSSLTGSLGNELGLSGGVSTASAPPASPASAGGGLLGGNFLNDAALFGLGYYGLSQAKNAQNQVNQEIAPLQSESSSMLGESKNLMSQYQSGQLPSWAQSVLNPISSESNSLISQYNNGQINPAEQQYANSMNSEANTLLGNYNKGQINPAEQKYANEINNVGSNLIQQYKSGNLPSWAKSYVDWTSQEATDLLTASPTKALETLATQNFTDYTSGKLKPGDEIALDQQTQAQKARIQSMYASAGDANSSAMEAQFQQIDNQAQVTRQQILNSYFQTGDKAYNDWLSTNVNAAQIKAQGAQFSNTVFANMLSQGLQSVEYAAGYTAQGLQSELQSGLSEKNAAASYTANALNSELSAGMQGSEFVAGQTGTVMNNILTGAEQTATVGDTALSQAIGIQLQSDNNLSKMVGSLMQSIATAYSYSAYQRNNGGGGGGYGGGGGGGGGGSTASMIENIVGGIEQYGAGAVQLARSIFSGAGGQAAAESGASGASGALGDAGMALGALGAGYSLYNTVENWQSGNTGADALNAAETGAAIGSMVMPGIGTVAGLVIGGAVGAISSAFGGGKTDPETLNWNNLAPQLSQDPAIANSLTPAQAYQSLAGLMDAKDNSPGHSTNLELKFGRMGEGNLMTTIAGVINKAMGNNPNPNVSAQWLYQNVVQPYLEQTGAYVKPTDIVSSKGTKAGGSVDALLTRLIGLWQAGNLNSSTPVGVSGQTIPNLPAYGA